MDKKSILALVLIAVIIILLPYYQEFLGGDQPQQPPTQQITDSLNVADPIEKRKEIPPQVIKEKEIISVENNDEEDSKIDVEVVQDSFEKKTVISTNLIEAVISNKGGGTLQKFVLKKFSKYDSSLVNMIEAQLKNGTEITFQTPAGEYVNLADYLFTVNTELPIIKINNEEPQKIEYVLNIGGSVIKKTFTFYPNKYHFDLAIEYKNSKKLLLNNKYRFGWKNGLPSTESYEQDDNNYNQTYINMGGEVDNFDITDEGRQETTIFSGTAEWVAIRTKYFVMAIFGMEVNNIESIYYTPEGIQREEYVQRIYDIGFYKGYDEGKLDNFRIYMGPMDHKELEQYENGLNDLVLNNGWYEKSFRFFSMIILYILQFLHRFIPNYGWVIVIFSILIKLVLYPLTKKSYTATREMQKVQPLMAEIKEKYKGDSQRMNKETMKLYKEHGVNPLGGCLPMLLQMPLLLGLFIVFRSTIQLRGASFIPGWIDDLSRTEGLFNLPFSLPMYGDEFNLLPILMAVAMIFQSKMTMQDPKQKAMVYMMPVMMLLFFNRFPSGLNLYYTLFNVWTILQQKYLHRDKKNEIVKQVKTKQKPKRRK